MLAIAELDMRSTWLSNEVQYVRRLCLVVHSNFGFDVNLFDLVSRFYYGLSIHST